MTTSNTTDAVDQRLLNDLQTDFPLTPEPFAALGVRLGLDGAEVIERVSRLKAEKVIRQISAIFDSRRLGYRSSLVAMKLPADAVDDAAAIINLHPGVSHNYRRNHAYNLWFTIAVPPPREVADEVAVLAEKVCADQARLMPTLRLFKIGVNFDMTGETEAGATEREEDSLGLRAAAAWQRSDAVTELSTEQREAVARLQRDLPLTTRPFAELAGTELSEDALLAHAAAFLADDTMRRFAAVLHHRKAGFGANAMGVWTVPEDRIEALGQQMAHFRAVSHCYHRPSYPDWPYSLFTMIHGRDTDECEAAAAAISQATGISEYHLLYSDKEYKKTRVRYFAEDDQFDVRALPSRRAER
ncbi:MAG: Lrp/AsnC family transcriptional regulator [Armatimonadetes bacterium]|nr:Lrp/AsnC family transcriptional regulator [Armatimonadota bacterium]